MAANGKKYRTIKQEISRANNSHQMQSAVQKENPANMTTTDYRAIRCSTDNQSTYFQRLFSFHNTDLTLP